VRVAAAALAAVLLTSGCVGPSRTDADYGEKVEGTARAVASAAQTALVGVGTVAKDHAYRPYLAILVRDAEDEASSAQATLDSVQPPSDRADAMHDEVADLVSGVVEVLRALRIEVRRGHLSRLAEIAAPLSSLVERLDTIAGERT
jgi:hypothetical protein